MKALMEIQFALTLLTLVLSVLALLLVVRIARQRAKLVGNEPAVVVPKDLTQPTPESKPKKTPDDQSTLDQMSADINFLVNHFKIEKEVTHYGTLIMDAYDNFMLGINDEFEVLEQRRVEGPEYHFRSNMLLFSLMMARVYMGLYGSEDSLKKLESYIERAKRL